MNIGESAPINWFREEVSLTNVIFQGYINELLPLLKPRIDSGKVSECYTIDSLSSLSVSTSATKQHCYSVRFVAPAKRIGKV